jgi:uncharacterized membrane protein YtjA (UPF0391 family)
LPRTINTLFCRVFFKRDPAAWAFFRFGRNTGGNMLYYALVFLVVALVAGFLGFGGVAFAAAGIAKILFFVFLLVFLLTLITHLTRGGAARS